MSEFHAFENNRFYTMSNYQNLRRIGQEFDLYRTPIITSLLDTDFYKFTMGQGIHKRYPDVPVKFAFKNRTKGVKLANIIDLNDLRKELDHVRDLRFNKSEIHYLRGTNEYSDRMFGEPYLDFLEDLRLPPYKLEVQDGDLKLEFPGKWSEVTYWEIPALSIVNELYTRAQLEPMSQLERERVISTGVQRLAYKVDVLKKWPYINFIEFGTRRRGMLQWQDYTVDRLADSLPKSQFRGTSNTYLAMKYGLLPMGTNAHEDDVVYSGIWYGNDEEIRSSHQRFLNDWWEDYGWGLSIALTDTFGSDFFFKDMTTEQAMKWKGLRQDSGDPFKFTEKALAFYDSKGIDPREKIIIYSDGLDLDKILKLEKYTDRIKKSYGWGTNLTNDFDGLKPISIVIKVVEANGHGTVKLSDNPAKAIGRPEDIERFKKIFDYKDQDYIEVIY